MAGEAGGAGGGAPEDLSSASLPGPAPPQLPACAVQRVAQRPWIPSSGRLWRPRLPGGSEAPGRPSLCRWPECKWQRRRKGWQGDTRRQRAARGRRGEETAVLGNTPHRTRRLQRPRGQPRPHAGQRRRRPARSPGHRAMQDHGDSGCLHSGPHKSEPLRNFSRGLTSQNKICPTRSASQIHSEPPILGLP